MVDPTTTNMVLSVPLRGTDTGTWDTPVNGNFTILDAAFGGITTVAVSSAGTATLPASASQCNVIRVSGTLTTNYTVLVSSTIFRSWTIENLTTNSSAFYVTFLSAASTGSVVGMPPGQAVDCFFDGTTMKYRNLDKLGAYWDYAGSSVPSWVSASTIPPYLNCDGTAFSTTVYPYLAAQLGTATLPDLRGVTRATLNQGTSRMTSSAGVDGNTNYSRGGSQGVSIAQTGLPNVTLTASGNVTTLSTKLYLDNTVGFTPASPTPSYTAVQGTGSLVASTGTFSGVTGSLNTGVAQTTTFVMQPTTVAGITMIRAA